MAQPTDEKAKVVGTELSLVKGGSGKPLLVLHDELGYTGWQKWNEALSSNHELIIPRQPGFGHTDRQDWIWEIRDVASFYTMALREMGHDSVDVIGFSAGGYIAAEMAAADPSLFNHMVLVGPMGIQPSDGAGFIYDMFACTVRTFIRASVEDAAGTEEFGTIYGGEMSSEQFELFEDARAESARIAWEPYMFSRSLPTRLGNAGKVPTLIVHGAKDQVVPADCIAKYKAALPQAEVVTVAGVGHRPEIEATDEFVGAVSKFLAS